MVLTPPPVARSSIAVSTNETPTPASTATKRPRVEDATTTDPFSAKRNHATKHQQHQYRLPRTNDFFRVQASHPYGILPGGNQFTVTMPQEDSSHQASPSCWSRLIGSDDEAVHSILQFCDGPDLARLAQVSRYTYAVCHQPELWRDLVLRYRPTTTTQTQTSNTAEKQQPLQPSTALQTLERSWKDTYVRIWRSGRQQRGKTTPTSTNKFDDEVHSQPHQPMSVPGVYSDYFYRLHSCRTFAIPSQWLFEEGEHAITFCPEWVVPCVPFKEMTPHRFYEEFEQPNQPVLIQGAAKEWKCFERWKDDSYLLTRTKGCSFRATSGAAPLPAQFTLEAYRQYCDWQTTGELEEAPLYLFDRTALQPGSALWKDFHENLCQTCPYFDISQCPQHDLLALLGEGRRPDHTWWIVGPQRSGSIFHTDPNATHAWNATIRGRKRWIFYPPGDAPPGVHPSADADHVALPLTVGEWLRQFWSQHLQRLRKPPQPQQPQRPMEITANPGDVLFVPHGWWHMVINLDEGMNIALTHNYVSQSNLCNVLRFFQHKEDQISGCRDRAESIKPHELHQDFCNQLQLHHPRWLKEAQAVQDWTCSAWSNSKRKNKNRDKNSTRVTASSVMATAKAPRGQLQSGTNNSNLTADHSNSAGFSFCFL